MKTLIATTLAGLSLLALTSASYGQGQITFANSTAATPITFGSGPNAGSKIFGPGTTYTYGLFLGASTATSFSQLVLVDTTGNPTAANAAAFTAGALNGGTVTAANANANSTGFVLGTGTYAIEVAGWLTADGSYAQALANGDFAGLSTLGTITPTLAGGSSGAPQVFGSGAAIPTGFSLSVTAVPEPTTMALGGIGAAALLMFRRKK